MYNLSAYICSLYLKITGNSVRMKRCIAEVRGLFNKIIKDPLISVIDTIISFTKQFKKHLLLVSHEPKPGGVKNTGRYRSLMTIEINMLMNRIYMNLIEFT